MTTAPVEIAIAVVQDEGGRFLVGERPAGVPLAGLAEFPGGKIEAGEAIESAAARECLEETGLVVIPRSTLATIDHTYEHARVRLHFIHCVPSAEDKEPRPPYRFVSRQELARLRFPEANGPVVAQLVRGELARGRPARHTR